MVVLTTPVLILTVAISTSLIAVLIATLSAILTIATSSFTQIDEIAGSTIIGTISLITTKPGTSVSPTSNGTIPTSIAL